MKRLFEAAIVLVIAGVSALGLATFEPGPTANEDAFAQADRVYAMYDQIRLAGMPREDIRDPWGHLVKFEYRGKTLIGRSAGPDGEYSTVDDLEVMVDQRTASTLPPSDDQ